MEAGEVRRGQGEAVQSALTHVERRHQRVQLVRAHPLRRSKRLQAALEERHVQHRLARACRGRRSTGKLSVQRLCKVAHPPQRAGL